MPTSSPILWLAVATYVALAFAFALRAQRSRSDNGAAYWTAGRDLGALSVGLSMSAGFLSISWATVYSVQLYYWYGLGGAWLITIPWLLELGGIYFLARRYHRLAAFSQAEMVGQRFGVAARRVVALAVALVFLVWGGAEIYVAANLLAPGLGIPRAVAAGGIALVVGGYAAMGGFRAIVATDRMQFALVAGVLLLASGCAIVALARADAPLDFSAFEGSLSGQPFLSLFAPGLALVVVSFIAYVPSGLFEPDLWLRVQAARSERAARGGVALAIGASAILLGVVPALLAYAAHATLPPDMLGTDGDGILIALVSHVAAPWVLALVAVGLVAAAMSTVDTGIHVVALSIGYDGLGVAGRGARWVTAGAVVATAVVALAMDSLWDAFYLSAGILTCAVALPTAAVLWPRAKPGAVLASAVTGLVGVPTLYALERAGGLAHALPEAVAATGLGYIVYGLAAAVLAFGVGQRWGRG